MSHTGHILWLYFVRIYLIGSCFILSLFHLIGICYWFYLRRKRSTYNRLSNYPGISILKPLVGLDRNTEINLESFFNLKYPNLQLLFCIQSEKDPVLNVVRMLQQKYGSIDCSIHVCGRDQLKVGMNPKICNLMQGYNNAKYELMMVSDSSIYMTDYIFYDIVKNMDSDVGLVHQLPFTSNHPSFSRVVEKVCFGTQQARLYLAINFLGYPCLTGMSFLFRKSVLDKIGGLSKFASYLAEDYYMAKAFIDNGWRIKLSLYPAVQNASDSSLRKWMNRMIRWCQLRVRLSPLAWFEPLQDCFVSGLLTSIALHHIFHWNVLYVFIPYVLIWILADYTLLTLIQESPLPFSKIDFLIAWFFRETISLYIYASALVNPVVFWRYSKIKLKWKTRLSVDGHMYIL